MNSSRKLLTAAALTLVGAAVSVYQTHHFFELRSGMSGLRTFCQIGSFDCVAVELSKYAEIIPGLPLSALAAAWLIVQLVILLMAAFSPSRALTRFAFFQSILSLGTTLVYLGVMAGVLKAWCILCLTLDGINLINFFILFSAQKQSNAQSSSDSLSWKLVLGTGAGTLALAMIFSRALNPMSGISQTQITEYVDSLLLAKPIAVNFTPQEVVSGSAQAPITIIKFSDFECPACKMGAQSIHPVLSQFGDRIKFVFKNHPLDNTCNRKITRPLHKNACLLARIALCAQSQGKMETVYETFFDNQDEIAKGSLDPFTALATHGISDVNSLKTCAASPETQTKLSKQIEEGIALGIDSTPTFFINGIKIAGGVPAPVWKQLIERLLKK